MIAAQEPNFRERAISRLEADERDREVAGQAQRKADENAAWAKVREREAAAEAIAVKQLSELRPLYQRRDEAASELAGALGCFFDIEARITEGLRSVKLEQPMGASESAIVASARERLARLRREAGLSPRHDDLVAGTGSIGWRLFATVYVSLRNGTLRPGVIVKSGG